MHTHVGTTFLMSGERKKAVLTSLRCQNGQWDQMRDCILKLPRFGEKQTKISITRVINFSMYN